MRQFAIIGLGEFGRSVALTLAQKGAQVIGIDKNEDVVRQLSDKLTDAVQADARDEKSLKALGIQDVDVAVVSIGEDLESSILITLTLKKLGVKEVIAKAVSENQAKVLEKIGADRVIQPEKDMGVRVANSLLSPRIIDHIELSGDYSLLEMAPPRDFIGKSLKEIDIRKNYGLNVIAIKHAQGKIDIAPRAEHIIQAGDLLVVIGHNSDIERVKKKK